MPTKRDGRNLYVAFQRNGCHMSERFRLEKLLVVFYQYFLPIAIQFCIENDEEVTKCL